MKHFQLIELAAPCTACVITNHLAREVLEKLEREHPRKFTWEVVVLATPWDAKNVEGLEVETYPALLLDGVQITAGSIPNRRQLAGMVEE